MSKFFNEHPFIALVMVGLVCEAVIETAHVITNGEREYKFPFFNKKEQTQEQVESVKE